MSAGVTVPTLADSVTVAAAAVAAAGEELTELLQHVALREAWAVLASGSTPQDGSVGELAGAIGRGLYFGAFGQGGGVNALTCAIPAPAFLPALPPGLRLSGFVQTPNAAGPCTLAVTGVGAAAGVSTVSVKLKGGGDPAAADLLGPVEFKIHPDGTARLAGPSASELRAIAAACATTVYLTRPGQNLVWVDPVSGNDANDGATLATSKKDIEAVIDAMGPNGTEIRVLNDFALTRRHAVYAPLTIGGVQAAANAAGYTQVARTMSVQGTATNSPDVGGNTFCPGIDFLSGNVRTSFINYAIGAVPSGLTNPRVFTALSELGASISYGTLNALAGTGASLFGASNGMIAATFASFSLGASAPGHVFEGVAAGGNPNATLIYRSNSTAC